MNKLDELLVLGGISARNFKNSPENRPVKGLKGTNKFNTIELPPGSPISLAVVMVFLLHVFSDAFLVVGDDFGRREPCGATTGWAVQFLTVSSFLGVIDDVLAKVGVELATGAPEAVMLGKV